MECRTPLYSITNQSSNSSPTGSTVGSRGANRTSSWALTGSNSPKPPQPVIKKRLPLPKNVVLLSLIEATALASEEVQQPPKTELTDSSTRDLPEEGGESSGIEAVRTIGSMIDADEEEEEKIKLGTTLAVGEAGTYAVAVKEGLEIFPTLPKSVDMDMSATLVDDEIEGIKFSFAGKSMLDDSVSSNCMKLSHGDRVQVVCIRDGWAKLARGYGYVSAKNSQLVKGTCCLVLCCGPAVSYISYDDIIWLTFLSYFIQWEMRLIERASLKQSFETCHLGRRSFVWSKLRSTTSSSV